MNRNHIRNAGLAFSLLKRKLGSLWIFGRVLPIQPIQHKGSRHPCFCHSSCPISWLSKTGQKNIRKPEILCSLLTEKRQACKFTAKAKFKRARFFQGTILPLISNIILHLCVTKKQTNKQSSAFIGKVWFYLKRLFLSERET